MYRVHSYQQLEYSDCGVTCIRIIARYYGKKLSPEQIYSVCDMSRLGISIGDIVQAFKGLGMDSVAVRLSPDEALRMPLPSVLFWDQKHFVVLYKIKRGKYYIVDPSRGKLKFCQDEFYEHWLCGNDKGIAILADPTDEFESREFEKPKTNWRLLSVFRNALLKHKKSFAGVVFFSLLTMLGDVAMPLMFQHTVDDGINGKNISLVWLLIIAQLFVFFGNYISGIVVDLILTKLGLKMGINMMNEYLLKLVRMPMIFFARKVNSDLIQKTEDQNRIKNFLVSMPDQFFFTILTLIVFCGMLVYYNALIFIIFFILTVLGLGWTTMFLGRRREIDYAYNAAIAENRNNLYELIHGMPEIKANNAQQVKIDNWNTVQEKVNRLSVKSAFMRIYMNGGNSLLARLKDIAVTGICATLVIKDLMTFGEMMTISYIIGRLSGPFNNILGSVSSIQDACMSYARVEEVLNADQEQNRPANAAVPAGDICIEGVGFKYPGSGSPYVLQDLNMVIPKGKFTALVGSSGCGKTTLIKLILGMFTPQKGRISIGDTSLSDIDEDAWLRSIGVVMQNGTLFSGTLLSNIALGDGTPDPDRARKAAEVACIDDFIQRLPMGYNTKIGVAGIEISGGQKQRLLIARAIYKNPEILVLDEATSSLDAGNEARIVRNLEKFFKGRTVIVAAHRLSTVKCADNIVLMDAGVVKEQGNHIDLVNRQGQYYKLVKNQLELDI